MRTTDMFHHSIDSIVLLSPRTRMESRNPGGEGLERPRNRPRKPPAATLSASSPNPVEVLIFEAAMREYRERSGRLFPTWSEVLEVLNGLGYAKPAIPKGGGDPAPPDLGTSSCRVTLTMAIDGGAEELNEAGDLGLAGLVEVVGDALSRGSICIEPRGPAVELREASLTKGDDGRGGAALTASAIVDLEFGGCARCGQ